MQRIDENTYIDDTLVTCAEYQLFIDEMREQGKYYQPDHWTSYQFSEGKAREPILGVRHSDAVTFCEWLTQRQGGEWKFRLPSQEEVAKYKLEAAEYIYWTDPPIEQQVLVSSKDIQRITDLDAERVERISEAFDIYQMKPKSSALLLYNVEETYASIVGRSRFSKDNDEIDPISLVFGIKEREQQNFVNSQLLRSSSKSLEVFDLNFEAVIPIYKTRFLEERVSKVFIQNLPPASYGYKIEVVNVVDLSKDLISNTDLFLSGRKFEGSSTLLLDEFSKSVEVHKRRDWQKQNGYDQYDLKNVYQFFRWYERTLLLALFGKRNKVEDKDWHQLVTKANKLFFNFTYLESCVEGITNPLWGIRIVKEKKG